MNKNTSQKGQVIIINTLLFFALSTAIIFAVTSPVISSYQITKSFSKSKQAFLLANSASNEALYKLNANMTLSSPETLTLSQGDALITVADTTDGKTVSVGSDVDSYERNYELKLSVGTGVSFNYGLQVGAGGLEMSGNSTINGNVYSNGDVNGNGGAFISGSAVAANVTDPVLVTSNNGGVIDPPAEINFGGNTTSQDAAQSFTVSTSTPISSVRILIKKSGSAAMNNITMRIVADNSGKPHKTTLAEGIISAPTITTTYNYLTVPLTSTLALTPGITYWVVFDTVTVTGQYYALGANDASYTGGVAKTSVAGWRSSDGGTWIDTSPATLDQYFDIYVGGSVGIIDGVTVGSVGMSSSTVWSFEVKNSSVVGTIYCQTGINNNKDCNISRANPVQQSFPISDGNIDDWKSEATTGGATTTISIGGSTNKTIGPVKVNGDINVGSGATLNIAGTVYVTGDVSVTGGGKIRVSPTLGASSAVIVTDGKISSSGGGDFEGSGTAGSYLMIVTTSTCPIGAGCSGNPAIKVTGGTGAVVLNAQKGTIEFSGGAEAKQATANKITMTSATLTYESGLVNPTFTSGPGGTWNIDSWKEVE